MSFRFDLTDLRLFLNVVDSGSITAGARLSHLSLPAASARVAGMEAEVTTTLLLRGRRGVQATAAGHTLARHARTVLRQAERLRAELEQHARGASLTIALVGTSAAIREYLPELLGRFLVQHPQVNLKTAELGGEACVQAVLDGSADIAFVTEFTATRGLQSWPLLMNRFALVVPRGHPLVQQAQGQPISVALADICDVVGLPVGSALQDTWEQRALARGNRLNYRVRVPGFDAQLRLIERGVGVAMLPDTAARRGARTMAVELLALSDPFLNRQLLMCVRKLQSLPEPTQALVQHLRHAAAGPMHD